MASKKRKTKNTKPIAVSFDEAVSLLDQASGALYAEGLETVCECAETLTQIADMVLSDNWSDPSSDIEDAMNLVIDGAAVVNQAMNKNSEAIGKASSLHEELLGRFADQLGAGLYADEWFSTDEHVDAQPEENPVAPTAAEITALLGQLRDETDQKIAQSAAEPEPKEAVSVKETSVARVEESPTTIHPELREAFLDDSVGCLAAMEQALLNWESDPGSSSSLAELSRELHTLKGASASIGLNQLAAFIHEVEDRIRSVQSNTETLASQELFGFVDTIRQQVDQFRAPKTVSSHVEESAGPDSEKPAPATADAFPLNDEEPPTDDETVRIKSSRLNRLMDMLSELVMLRNERDSELTKLMSINESLLDNVSRLRTTIQDRERSKRFSTEPAGSDESGASDGTPLTEITNDIMDSAHRLRDCYQPVADGNNAVSLFIRNFRQELVQLRRTPVSGLFLRLRRAVSEAARSEGKQVTMKLLGQQTGIERSLQSRIFEPLLHVVRNSVSHGIELPDARVAAGKTPVGNITLHAHSGPDLLVIEISDDGAGLDYDAIRRIGLDRGLIEPNESASHQELAQLIFHPGFSTRETVNQVSGRGVGMDVVASTLQRMSGWIEVDSSSGKGTTVRLSLPLPSMIQHAMVFRTNRQLFAVPMQSVQRAGEIDPGLDAISIDQLLGHQADHFETPTQMIVLASNGGDGSSTDRLAVLVDQIIGPEEVVVRPLPKLVKQHPTCSGATLSSQGEVVLILDTKRLIEFWQFQSPVQRQSPLRPARCLVVDDSRAARLRVCQSLSRYDVDIVQACDGQEAMELIQSEDFSAVFSDIDMPRKNGIELLREIKQRSTTQQIPVALISSRDEPSVLRKSSEYGALACIQKPLNDAALDSVLQQMSYALPHLNFQLI